MLDTNELISSLKNTIISSTEFIKSNKLSGNYEWTQQIKESLGSLGETHKFKICASTRNKIYNAEWMYDMIWYKENDYNQLIEVPLVVESEWSLYYKDVKYDFEKLLLANSQLKLLICNCPQKDVRSWISNFKNAIEVCQFVRKGDKYLIAILQLNGYDAEEFLFVEIEKGK